MKTTFLKKTRQDPELLALKEELQSARGDLSLAYRRFDQAVDPELVESCIYQIKAEKARAIKERSPESFLPRLEGEAAWT